MSEAPFFSVIVPVFNREKYLKKALDSLLTQTYQNFETIIVDDASTDSSLKIAEIHPIGNKHIIANKTNSERCISRNKGINASQGKYICFLDSDDYHMPEHLELLHSFILEKGEPEAFFSQMHGTQLKKGNCLKENVRPLME
jgi:glycosyltransferase involved in cell wall biosynthesis